MADNYYENSHGSLGSPFIKKIEKFFQSFSSTSKRSILDDTVAEPNSPRNNLQHTIRVIGRIPNSGNSAHHESDEKENLQPKTLRLL